VLREGAAQRGGQLRGAEATLRQVAEIDLQPFDAQGAPGLVERCQGIVQGGGNPAVGTADDLAGQAQPRRLVGTVELDGEAADAVGRRP
jgi:hypothetical protein